MKRLLKDYLVLTLATFLYAFAWENFMICNDLSSGGLTGVCTLIQIATGGAIPVDMSYLVFNSILLIGGFLILGKGFGFKTIYCIALATVLFRVLPMWEAAQCVPGNFLYIPEKFLIPVVAGLCEAVAIGLIFIYGGSTGGSDILALIVNKFWPVSTGRFFMATDVFIVASILLIPGKTFSDVIYGYLMMVTFSLTLDFVLEGRKSTVQMLVFSKHYDKIADYIINELDRGVTAMNGVGWFTKQERKVLLIVMRRREQHEVSKAIHEIDPRAFVSISPAHSVFGEGFEEMKTGFPIKKNKTNNA